MGKVEEKELAKAKRAIHWLDQVEEHDYAAAESYLLLIYEPTIVEEYLVRLQATTITQFKAKDIFRASQLPLLGISNSHVDRDRSKIKRGMSLSPLLLIRDPGHGKVVIADGYHRLCAVYSFDENAWIMCKIV